MFFREISHYNVNVHMGVSPVIFPRMAAKALPQEITRNKCFVNRCCIGAISFSFMLYSYILRMHISSKCTCKGFIVETFAQALCGLNMMILCHGESLAQR